jgi:hypothetical protein
MAESHPTFAGPHLDHLRRATSAAAAAAAAVATASAEIRGRCGPRRDLGSVVGLHRRRRSSSAGTVQRWLVLRCTNDSR